MRLFLSSYRAGGHNAELLDFLRGIEKVAFISNAKDYKTQAERNISMRENFDFWQSLRIEPSEVDLKPYFHKTGAEKLLDGFDFVWLAGGNAFLLRRALKYSGLDKYLIGRVRSGSLAYGGESAGAILAAPTLRGSEDEDTPDHEDDPNYVPKGYDRKVLWDGLGFLDFVPVPHYQSADVGESIVGYIKYLDEHKIPRKTIREDQVLIVDGGSSRVLG